MKRITALMLFTFFLINHLTAQLTAEQRIQDSVIGWWNNNRFDNKIKPTADPVQKRRVQICDSIASWVKKSYTPVASLGTFTRYNGDLSYGVSFDAWNVSHDKKWTDEKGRFKPIPEENTTFALEVNTLPAVTPVDFLNHEKDFYFLLEPDEYMTEQTANRRKGIDFKNNSNIRRFITRITNGQNWVMLAPGNISPFVQVTIGEFLDKAEASIAKEKIKEKEIVDRTFSGNGERDKQSRLQAWSHKEKQFEIVLARINKWRQVHKNRLQEPATFRASQQSVLTGFNTDDIDPFSLREIEKQRKQYQIVYKITKEVVEKCKADKPQWITAWWSFAGAADGVKDFELSTAMMENINYEYIYNYFFSPEKINGISYKPANEEQLQQRLNAYRTKYRNSAIEVPNTKPAASGAFFFDDFSTGTIGTTPRNWYHEKGGVEPFTLNKVNGFDGNWLKLSYGRRISPSFLKNPLPQNFKMEFDVVTDPNFTTRTGGNVELILNTEKINQTNQNQESRLFTNGTVLKIEIHSGNDADADNNNYRGLIKASINSSPTVNRENFEEGIYAERPLRAFNGKKNKVHISILVKDGKVTILANEQPVIQPADFKMKYGGACVLCGVPTGRSFNFLAFNNITNNAKETGVYISNIKITKE
ncbi:hypothetical protein ESA94_03600 [Lacibacter luteus]|uniref:Uncharacterized protein n=1 Tax=Lacibacter luteus TaxID=2508719 RepID=A0A4Q1CM78_9BACT|nr:hypothetical protein [Lacibacter luteus]RXK62110.1 hypothetical protein ESA94_03600 [Lacibacter luteus]